jgi:hypothetical protein
MQSRASPCPCLCSPCRAASPSRAAKRGCAGGPVHKGQRCRAAPRRTAPLCPRTPADAPRHRAFDGQQRSGANPARCPPEKRLAIAMLAAAGSSAGAAPIARWRGLGTAARPPWPRPAPPRHAHRLLAAPASAQPTPTARVPVLLLPGFLSGAQQYEELAALLRRRGHPTGAPGRAQPACWPPPGAPPGAPPSTHLPTCPAPPLRRHRARSGLGVGAHALRRQLRLVPAKGGGGAGQAARGAAGAARLPGGRRARAPADPASRRAGDGALTPRPGRRRWATPRAAGWPGCCWAARCTTVGAQGLAGCRRRARARGVHLGPCTQRRCRRRRRRRRPALRPVPARVLAGDAGHAAPQPGGVPLWEGPGGRGGGTVRCAHRPRRAAAAAAGPPRIRSGARAVWPAPCWASCRRVPPLLPPRQEKRQGEAPGLPADVAGSSLRFANHCYPGAQSHPGVRVTCVVGRTAAGGRRCSAPPSAPALPSCAAGPSPGAASVPACSPAAVQGARSRRACLGSGNQRAAAMQALQVQLMPRRTLGARRRTGTLPSAPTWWAAAAPAQ